eukprot:NODE_2943_length_2118_cov_9.197891.p1 GENE.NODE_2943_length_2118_cov_9.197891~~NODE_2943_length_2118_cov_9.197891.p1  ORF type:complete len:624 (+),score=166.34 NODE_2943_length_2118_cov_9.197891:60-1874(+)
MPSWCLFFAYFWFAFLIEEDLLNALRHGGMPMIRRGIRESLTTYRIIYIPAVAIWARAIDSSGIALREVCWQRPDCQRFLHIRPPWLSLDLRPSTTPPFIDLGDIQWREFRNSWDLPVAGIALGLFMHALVCLSARRGWAGQRRVVLARLVIGLLFVSAIHGTGVLFHLALALTFHLFARKLAGTRVLVPAVWCLAVLAIAAKDDNNPLRKFTTFGRLGGHHLAFLDDYGGFVSWHSTVNLLLLRLLSYALDCHAAATLPIEGKEMAANAVAVADASCAAVPAEVLLPPANRYTFMHCVTHAFYAPLFIAGPTICFDDFVEQCYVPRPHTTSLRWYFLQFLWLVAAIEIGTHMYPCFALGRAGGLETLGPKLGFSFLMLTLNLMWLKFAVIWRFARGWALFDGINPPENQVRALCDHYSVMGFWRCWHASFNQWLVRYIYIPVGGKNSRLMGSTLVFVFVSYWHEFELKLFAWGVLNIAFIGVEMLVSEAIVKKAKRRFDSQPRLSWLVEAVAAVSCIHMLMVTNIIGYALGVGGFSALAANARKWALEAMQVGLFMSIMFVVGYSIMMDVRAIDGTLARAAQKASKRLQEAPDVRHDAGAKRH